MEGLFYLGIELFGLGVVGVVLNRENLLLVLISLELVLLSILLIWVSATGGIDDFSGQIFIFMVLINSSCRVCLGACSFSDLLIQ